MTKVILFDAYGTLFNEGKESVPKISKEIVKKFALDLSYKNIFNEWKKNYLFIEKEVFSKKKPFKTIKEMNLESLTITFKKFNIKGNPSEFINNLFYLWSFPRLFPKVKRILSNLKGNYVLGILSNTDNKTLFSAIKHTKLKIDHIFTSEDAQSYKPNSEIFLKACKDLGVEKKEIIYVGNSIKDIIGAKKAGLGMIYINKKRESTKGYFYQPDYEVGSLIKVIEILKILNKEDKNKY